MSKNKKKCSQTRHDGKYIEHDIGATSGGGHEPVEHDISATSGGGYEPVDPAEDDERYGVHRCKECGEEIDFQ